MNEGFRYVVIAGVDSLLDGGALASYEERSRLLTSYSSNGFIPGEAAGALVVTNTAGMAKPSLAFLGAGSGVEIATIGSELPLRADGLVAAIRGALDDSGCTFSDLDFRVADISGEQYGFKEAAIALTRVMRERRERFELLHISDCVGEVGAAACPLALASTFISGVSGYSLGPLVLFHGGNDDGRRVSAVFRYQEGNG